MASYVRPTAAEVIERYSLRPSMLGLEDDEEAELETRLGDLVEDAEDAMVAHVSEAIAESDDLTDRQARQLVQAVRLRTVAAVDNVLADLVAAGEQEERLAVDPDTLRRQALDREGKAEELEGAAKLAVEQADQDAGEQPSGAVGMFRSSTFAPSGVRPSDRIRDLSERSDREAGSGLFRCR